MEQSIKLVVVQSWHRASHPRTSEQSASLSLPSGWNYRCTPPHPTRCINNNNNDSSSQSPMDKNNIHHIL
uniref:Uncharacterized protein n=1 Tax=Chelonoidis abingdonii TaxID=106734 RepID=A0A8C0IQF8_CHEAB